MSQATKRYSAFSLVAEVISVIVLLGGGSLVIAIATLV